MPVRRDERGGLCLRGEVVLTEPLGYEKLVHISIGDTEVIAKSRSGFQGEGGGGTRISVDVSKVHFFSAETGRAMMEEAEAQGAQEAQEAQDAPKENK